LQVIAICGQAHFLTFDKHSFYLLFRGGIIWNRLPM